MAKTEDTVALQKGAIAPAQKEQTGSQKAVSLIDSLNYDQCKRLIKKAEKKLCEEFDYHAF